MDRSSIICYLSVLNAHNPADLDGDLNVLLDINIKEVYKQSGLNEGVISVCVEEIREYNKGDTSNIWKYICLSSYLLKELRDSLNNTIDSDVLSVQQTKLLKDVIRNYINIGLCSNLIENMPGYRKLPTLYVEENHNVFSQYNILAATTSFLIFCIQCQKLRLIILSDNYKSILSSLYQIIYCPLKKPSNSNSGNFIMSQEIYSWLLNDREKFNKLFDYISKSLFRAFYVKETMMLIEPNSPVWLKKAVSKNLDAILCGPKGIETVAWSMFDSTIGSIHHNDRSKNWKSLEILEKLSLNFYNKPQFDNICKQLVDLLENRDQNDKPIVILEDLYCLCVKRLFLTDQIVCETKLLPPIFSKFDRFLTSGYTFSDTDDITITIEQILRLLYSCFIGKSLQTTDLPIYLLRPYINVFFNLYSLSLDSSHNLLKNQLEDLVFKYMKTSDCISCFDNFLFDLATDEISLMRTDILIEFRNSLIFIKVPRNKIKLNVGRKADVLIRLCRKSEDLYVSLFLYYLEILRKSHKYFNSATNKDLLQLEDELTLDEITERKLMVYQNLSTMAEDRLIQEYINENPKAVIDFLKDSLSKILDNKTHKSMEYESEDFQTSFTIVMILQALVVNSTKENLIHYKTLSDIVNTLFCESLNLELKQLLKSLVDILCDGKFKPKEKVTTMKSELDKAIEDVCDPLLPVRGHGLLMLTKLIEKKDENAMNRKNYILNVFQQNLKNDDSFIYLTAIGGLAAMGDVFPDTVIKILTEEYSDFAKSSEEDGGEIRMKLGEILVRVTKMLGDMAPKYKSLLLNTFLVGTKDEDHLMRASSLSNLGEICRVLGYKLGSIAIEVLICVHAIITTDKAVEARRAAVTVIRQLLAGLESETIIFLKDHILEIYRTLKNIYYNDKDDIMRLQAQLALEELNENVKSYIFPTPSLHTDKNVIVLN